MSELRFGRFGLRSIVPGKGLRVWGFICIAVFMFMLSAAGFSQSVGNGLPYPAPQPGLPPMNRTANPTADANRLMEDSMKQQDQEKMKRFELINEQRQKEMISEIVRLIDLAHQLKTETEKGTPSALPPLEVRKVEEIEKLAHGIQHQMKASESN